MAIKTFEDILAWQKGRELYTGLNKDLASTKNYSYRDQLLRATLSITNNIAEGFDRGSNKELKQFLTIARGSSAEVRSMLILALDTGVLSEDKIIKYTLLVKDISRLLTGFIKSITPRMTDYRLRNTAP